MNREENHTREFLRLSTLLLGSTMTVMAGATISPALPQIDAVFQATPHAKLMVKLLLSVHALFIAISAPFIGLLMDRYGRKPVLIVSVTLYGLAGSSGFFLDTLYGIIVGRAFLGIAVAGIMSGFTTLIGDYFKGDKLNKVMGLQAAFAGFGGLIFLSMGGFLADIGWRYPFLIYFFAFLVLPGVVVFLYEPHIRKKVKNDSNDKDATTITPFKLVLSIYGLAFFGMLVFYMVPVQLPFHMKGMGDISNTQIGIAIGIMTLIGALSSMQFKRLRTTLSHPQIYMLFALFMGVGYGLLSLATSYWLLLVGLVIAGAGFGLLMPNVNVWLVSFVPASVRGKFVGGLATSFLLGQFVSPLLMEPLVRTIGVGNSFGLVGGLLITVAAGFLLYSCRKRM